MARPTGPLLSFSARGTIAKTATYSSWRGVQYVRQRVIPANPRTTSQLSTRHVFAWLQAVWKDLGPLSAAPWTLYAQGQPLTNRNAFGKANISPLISETDLNDYVMSPGAKGGLPPASATATPGSGQLTIAVTAPTPPTGWTVSAAVAACILDQDPHTGLDYLTTEAEGTSSPYSIVLGGLTSSVLYQWGAWLVWTKANGTPAYGTAIRGQATPT